MNFEGPRPSIHVACVSLVDGDPNIRHARQLMFRSANYVVCAYATFAAFLADPDMLACDCIVADVEGGNTSGVELLASTHRVGWRGSAILLTDKISAELAAMLEAATYVSMLPKAPADRVLIAAVDAAITRFRSRKEALVTV